MTELEVFGALAFIHLVAVITPGPDFALIVRYSLAYGRHTAFPAACGIGSGILVHVFYSILGLGIFIATNPLLFNAVKIAGVAYLLFVAYQGWLSGSRKQGRDEQTMDTQHRPVLRRAFRTGFLTNALNIKASLFFFALFVLLVNDSPLILQFLYGIYMALATAVYFCILAWLFGSLHPFLQKHFPSIEKTSAVVMALFAGFIFFGAQTPF